MSTAESMEGLNQSDGIVEQGPDKLYCDNLRGQEGHFLKRSMTFGEDDDGEEHNN